VPPLPSRDEFPRRYGPEDEIGAANEITADTVLRAASLITHGSRYNLGQILEPTSPTQSWRYWRTTPNLERLVPGHGVGINQLTGLEENIAGSSHSGTHLDGLGHIGIGESAYNGYRYADIINGDGLTRLGIETVPPFVTRGVVLDIAALVGETMLDAERTITAADLEGAAERQGVIVGPGDALLIHTGWGRLWTADGHRYVSTEPGIGLEAAAWCTDRRVSLIGADNWAVEVVTSEATSIFPVHQHCIARFGCYLLENVRTDELVRDGVHEFCFTVMPIRSKGASGSPVAPLAIA
jgi:kynurenine formamidase